MEDYLCLTLVSHPQESELDFKRRLSSFWTHILRNFKDDYEKVYAEHAAFEKTGDFLSRKYLIEAVVSELLTEQLHHQGMAFSPLDPEDLYSKYEASPPEWFWIEH